MNATTAKLNTMNYIAQSTSMISILDKIAEATRNCKFSITIPNSYITTSNMDYLRFNGYTVSDKSIYSDVLISWSR